MALAEALKSNTTLEFLQSAALPSNPHLTVRSFMLPCIPAPSSVLRCLSRTSHPARTWTATSHSYSRPGLALHAHSPYTACTHREPAAAAHVPARRVDRSHALLCPTGGWRDVRAPLRLPLPVAGCMATTSATTPSRPSGRPPAAASLCGSSERPCMEQHDRRSLLRDGGLWAVSGRSPARAAAGTVPAAASLVF